MILDQEILQQGRDAHVEQVIHPHRNKLFLHRDFTFDDDVWNLHFRATTAVPPSASTLTFHAFPSSLKDDVKEFIARECWGAELSNGSIRGILSVLRGAITFLIQRLGDNFSPINLTSYDATAIEEHFTYLKNQYTRRLYIATVARFAAFLREQHAGEPADFRPDPQAIPYTRSIGRPYSWGLEQVIPDEVSEALMAAIHRHNLVLEERAKISSTKQLSADHLYIVVLMLLLFSGKRVSEILLLKRDCLREPTVEEGMKTGPGIWLAYQNTKAHLGQKEIFITEPAAQLVREYVARVREWTEVLARESRLDKLFLTNWQAGGNIRVPSRDSFASWLSGEIGENGDVLRSGFIHHYAIKYHGEYYYINPHQTRHTLAHKAYLSGASYVVVGDHLDHIRTTEGRSPITGVYLHGQEKDVQLIREMHDRRVVTGKALPVLNNRSVTIRHLDPSDVTIWREQGMVVQPTHYGHCILPEASGPCVCGDPCWIGPKGDGCDYALYTPESKEALLEDRALLLQQVGDLEKSNPRHPRLGQWKARLERLNQVLSEITDAEERALSNMLPDRPRHGLVPQDPQFEPQQPQIPAKSLPRRNSRPSGAREPKRSSEPIQELDATFFMQADTILKELERRMVPMTIQALALRLGVKTHALYTCAPICDRLAQHNKRCPISMQEIMEAQFKELQTLKKTATAPEFAQQCGFSRAKLSRHFPEWQQKLANHNCCVRDEIIRNQAEQHLRKLIAAQTCEPLQDFAKHIGIAEKTFTRHCPDIAQRVLQHNRELGLRNSLTQASKEDHIAHIYKRWNEAHKSGKDFTLSELAQHCSVVPDTIRTLCPELLPRLRKPGEWIKKKIEAALAFAYAEIEKSGEVKTVKAFATAAGISKNTLTEHHHYWVSRLDQHNSITREANLQAAWTHMERSETAWSLEKFAKEAGICTKRIKKYYPDWRDRLKAEMARRDHEVTQRLDQVLEEARQLEAFLTPYEAAKEVGIDYTTLKGHFSSVYNRIVEYNETKFRPIVEDAWREVIASGECPTPTEFTQRCGIRHYSGFEKYFPDVAEQLRALDRQRGK
jgi:integrase